MSGARSHNGFTHQDPVLSIMSVNKKAEIVRVYLPPDANCLLVGDGPLPAQPPLRQRRRRRQTSRAAVADDGRRRQACTEGIGIWRWASNDQGAAPDVVMACCGDVPTLRDARRVSILREHLPRAEIRWFNVVDLMKLQPAKRASRTDVATWISTSFSPGIKPVIFAFTPTRGSSTG